MDQFDPNLYTIIGVGYHATTQEIQSAARKKMAPLHPDKAKSEEEKAQNTPQFRAINDVKEVLEDDVKRQEYDRRLLLRRPEIFMQFASAATASSDSVPRPSYATSTIYLGVPLSQMRQASGLREGLFKLPTETHRNRLLRRAAEAAARAAAAHKEYTTTAIGFTRAIEDAPASSSETSPDGTALSNLAHLSLLIGVSLGSNTSPLRDRTTIDVSSHAMLIILVILFELSSRSDFSYLAPHGATASSSMLLIDSPAVERPGSSQDSIAETARTTAQSRAASDETEKESSDLNNDEGHTRTSTPMKATRADSKRKMDTVKTDEEPEDLEGHDEKRVKRYKLTKRKS
jgi:curved DNA-binding protein CbpA